MADFLEKESATIAYELAGFKIAYRSKIIKLLSGKIKLNFRSVLLLVYSKQKGHIENGLKVHNLIKLIMMKFVFIHYLQVIKTSISFVKNFIFVQNEA